MTHRAAAAFREASPLSRRLQGLLPPERLSGNCAQSFWRPGRSGKRRKLLRTPCGRPGKGGTYEMKKSTKRSSVSQYGASFRYNLRDDLLKKLQIFGGQPWGFSSVSYTHLDVYKRQRWSSLHRQLIVLPMMP